MGIIFYDFIVRRTGFTYADEIFIFALAILAFFMAHKSDREVKVLFVLGGVFLFYLAYSFFIKSNKPPAIWGDFFIQAKPYLAFVMTLLIAPQINNGQSSFLRKLIILFSLSILFDGIFFIFHGKSFFLYHPSRLATASTILSLFYLYLFDFSKKSIVISMLILSFGFLSLRSKAYGFFVAEIIVLLFLKRDLFFKKKMKISPKNILIGLLSSSIIFVAGYKKFYFYFVKGSSDLHAMFARPALYRGMFVILREYIPFGSGFGSYATYFSQQYYSPMYYKLGLDTVHGLQPSNPTFISDAYYPALAEFGIIGVLLFFYFWRFVFRRMNLYSTKIQRGEIAKEKTIILMIMVFFAIELVSDSTITQNRGVFMMVLLAMCLNDLKRKSMVEHENPSR